MKKILLFTIVATLAYACGQNEEPESTLRQQTYLLHRANFNPTSGEVVITELSPGTLQFEITLQNTDENGTHPAHLHFGGVDEVGELAYALNPVDGETGKSVTILENITLSNGDPLSFESLGKMNGSVKVHMNDNFFKHMVLAFGNVGINEDYFFDGVAVCTGH